MSAKPLVMTAVLLMCSLEAFATPAPNYQQGPKLVGTGAVGAADQGWSVALSADGNTAIVGGYTDNSNAGAAWVYTRSAAGWSQQGKLVGTGAAGPADQGWSVALSADGNTAVVGGNADNGAAGAAWVYTRSVGVWSQQGSKLVGTGAAGAAEQGQSVALSADGNTAVVGGYVDNGLAGAAWVYTRSGGVWSQQGAKLVGTGAVGGAGQGWSVALSADGNTAVVGGYVDDGVAGAAWVYTRSGGVWSQQGSKLVGTGAVGPAHQGQSVALSADGNTAVVSGWSDNGGTGAAWVYTRSGGVWSQQGAKLVGTGAVGNADQGQSVALSADGNTAVVGGYNDNAAAGAAWVHTRSGGVWSQQGSKLVGTSAVGNAHQGQSVALSADGSTAIVGGYSDNSAAGAAWVFINASPRIAAIRDVPNDQGRQVRVSFISNLLDRLGSATPITGYYIYRREAVALSLPSWAVPLVAPGTAAAPTQVQLAGWDYVMTVPATTDSDYQTVVPTLADSNSTGFHRAVLFVRAATATPGIYFDSEPDSGYSADNLPPAPPTPLTGAYVAGATNLHWGANSEPDFWYYKLYRGSSAGFVPGAGNQIASKSDTGFVDVGPSGSYYKLSAVDVNGNESAFALLTPGATLGVGGGAMPGQLALAAPRPNPASEQTMLSFALPEAGPVQLAVYDMEGRRVRTVSSGQMEAGEHQLRFDLRDGGGRQIANGLYFVRLEAGGRRLVKRLAIVE